MFEFSDAADQIEPSATVAISSLANKLRLEGKPVISFAAGQPDFDTPKIVKNAAKKALDEGFTKYTSASGIVELKEAIVNKLQRENKLKYSTEEVIITNGAKQALYELIFALVGKGNEVLLPAPYWISYPQMIRAAGATVKVIPFGNKFKFTPLQLNKAITKKSKLLILNAPNNPTGAMYTKGQLRAISKVVLDNNLLVISDECYDQFYYNNRPQVSFASISRKVYERTITVNSFSKSYSMTGWRIGYAAGPMEIIRKLSALQSHMTSNPCSFAQKGAVAAINKAGNFPAKMRKAFAKRRKTMYTGLKNIAGLKPHLPDGAFYIFVDIGKLTSDSVDFARRLLEQEFVAVIPGKPFGAEEFVRLSFTTGLRNISTGIKRIEKFVKTNY
jgi:aspartate aminotransferase